VNRPLASRSLALWAFWSRVVFTPWAATGHGDPFPRWIIGLGLAGLFLGGAGLVAIGLNWWKTVEGQLGVLFSTLPGKLLGAAAVAYVLGGALDYVVALPDVAPVLRFTWIHQGLDWLLVGGAVGLSLFALLPDLLARSSGIKLAPGLLSAHAWLSLIGVALIAVALLLAGVVQGLGLSAGKPFLEVMRSSMHPVRFSTMGLLIFALGQVTFFVAVLRLLGATAREYVTVARGWFAPVQTGKEVVRP
jgi:cytochrome c oxidase cbb3-type subunit 1